MKKIVLSSLLVFFFALPCVAGQFQVLKVVDGDTIDVLYKGKKERIRLRCVDTPESVHPDQSRNTPLGKKASAYTKSRLLDKSVDLEFETKKRGNYGRLLAYVILDGKNFNLELVRKGWSEYYTKYGKSEDHHQEFVEAQKTARAAEINIWADGQDREKDRVPSATTTSEYHGNYKSHKFHQSGCRYYNCKACTIVFKNRVDVINGFH